jgi:hypothetical protein
MRLLNVYTLEFGEFEEIFLPTHSTLFHRWWKIGLSYKQYRKRVDLSGPGYRKIVDLCSFVRSRGTDPHRSSKLTKTIERVWIDTICIDKRSSAELSEAINSVCKWYEKAEECAVHLADVMQDPDPKEMFRQLEVSTWFTRGWTLQELLAQRLCVFVDSS